jgi:hypothetical protein
VQQTRDGKYTGLEGFRTKTICKAVVNLQWGKQRLLTKEAGTSNYLDAVRDGSSKYKDDVVGWRELWDIFLEQNRRTHAARSLVRANTPTTLI